jgi:Fe2+ or Zn2+ uptake regulation protein
MKKGERRWVTHRRETLAEIVKAHPEGIKATALYEEARRAGHSFGHAEFLVLYSDLRKLKDAGKVRIHHEKHWRGSVTYYPSEAQVKA